MLSLKLDLLFKNIFLVNIYCKIEVYILCNLCVKCFIN